MALDGSRSGPGLRYEQQKLVGNPDDFTWSGNWAPRLGATYDPTGTGRSKIYAIWGRFFARMPNDLAARALSADAGVTRDDFFDAALTQPIPAGTLAGGATTHFMTAGLSAADFDADSKSTYKNEVLVGFEFELAPGLNLGIRYTHRNFGRVLEDVGLAPMISYFLGIHEPTRTASSTSSPIQREARRSLAASGFNICVRNAGAHLRLGRVYR